MKDLYALFRHSLAGLRVLVLLTLLLGVAYPLAVTGVAAVALPWQANGSLVTAVGRARHRLADDAVGSALLGQPVDGDGVVPAAAVRRRGRLRPAHHRRAPTSARRTPTSSRRSRSAVRRSPRARASTPPPSRRTR